MLLISSSFGASRGQFFASYVILSLIFIYYLFPFFAAIGHGRNKPVTKNFCYKCHRWDADVFSVNALHFSPMNTFTSIGSDGVICFWDKEAKHKLATLDMYKRACPGTDIKFSPNGQMLFYALSYDWSRGATGNDPKLGNNIYIHTVQPVEIVPKAQQPKR